MTMLTSEAGITKITLHWSFLIIYNLSFYYYSLWVTTWKIPWLTRVCHWSFSWRSQSASLSPRLSPECWLAGLPSWSSSWRSCESDCTSGFMNLFSAEFVIIRRQSALHLELKNLQLYWMRNQSPLSLLLREDFWLSQADTRVYQFPL